MVYVNPPMSIFRLIGCLVKIWAPIYIYFVLIKQAVCQAGPGSMGRQYPHSQIMIFWKFEKSTYLYFIYLVLITEIDKKIILDLKFTCKLYMLERKKVSRPFC